MSLSTLDKIQLKTEQIMVKADDYFRANIYPDKLHKVSNAALHSFIIFGSSAVSGVYGFATKDIPIAISGLQIPIKPSMIMVGGIIASTAFFALASVYKKLKGEFDYNIQGELDCWPKGTNPDLKSNNLDSLVRVSRKEVLKSFENGTFFEKYDAIKIEDHNYIGFAPSSLEEIASKPFIMKYVEGPKRSNSKFVLENTAAIEAFRKEQEELEKGYISQEYMKNHKIVSNKSEKWTDECKKIRRECFKEAKNSQLRDEINNRIKNFREKIGVSPKIDQEKYIVNPERIKQKAEFDNWINRGRIKLR